MSDKHVTRPLLLLNVEWVVGTVWYNSVYAFPKPEHVNSPLKLTLCETLQEDVFRNARERSLSQHPLTVLANAVPCQSDVNTNLHQLGSGFLN